MNSKHTRHLGLLTALLLGVAPLLSNAQTVVKATGTSPVRSETPGEVAFARIVNELTTAVEQQVPDKEPSNVELDKVCKAIMAKESGSEMGIGYRYEELLWALAGADVKGMKKLAAIKKELQKNEEGNQKPLAKIKQDMELARAVAHKKIQAFWLLYRKDCRCYGYSGITVGDGNVLKFAMDNDFPTVVANAVKLYGLDVNFKDPADGKTIMDFLQTRIASYKTAEPPMPDKVKQFERVYGILAAHGAKHAKDLP